MSPGHAIKAAGARNLHSGFVNYEVARFQLYLGLKSCKVEKDLILASVKVQLTWWKTSQDMLDLVRLGMVRY